MEKSITSSLLSNRNKHFDSLDQLNFTTLSSHHHCKLPLCFLIIPPLSFQLFPCYTFFFLLCYINHSSSLHSSLFNQLKVLMVMYDNLSMTMQAYCSSFTVLQLVTKAVCLLSIVIRWILLPCYSRWPTRSSDEHSAVTDEAKARHCIAAQAVRDSLHVLTYGELINEDDEITESIETSCTVCLTDMKAEDCVWELRNCSHVFHKGCLDLWLDHDEHLTCPLCRAPLLGELARLPTASPPSEPSWAVERLLYLFGDDLICAPSS